MSRPPAISAAIPLPASTRTGEIRWTCAPQAGFVLRPEELALDELARAGRVTAVKHGPHRSVYRMELDAGTVYWKHCRIYSTRSFLRECLRPPKAKLEFDNALALAERGIATVQPLAWGVVSRWWPGESFIITKALTDAVPLNTYLETALPELPRDAQPQLRRRIAEALACFVARLHEAGVRHPDLHPGNFLIEISSAGEPRFYLLDLHAIHLGKPLGRAASRENLAVFNRWFLLRAERTDRLRFWKTYAQMRGMALGDARALEQATWASNLRFWRGRDKRCLGNNRCFRRVHSPIAAGFVVRDIDPVFLERLLTDPDAPFRDPAAVLLKDSRSSTVVAIDVPTADGPRAMIYKRFRVTKWHDPWISALRRSPALRSWANGHGLRDRGLPTPRPWLVLHRRRWGLLHEGYLLCEKVEHSSHLHDSLAQLAALAPPDRHQRKWDLIDHLARLVRQLHECRLSHRDLKAANILVSSDFRGPSSERSSEFRVPSSEFREKNSELGTRNSELWPELWLIDLVGIRRERRLTRSRIVQNLARLHASFRDTPLVTCTDKLRFLRMYLNWAIAGRSNWKGWWNDVAAATRAKVVRNAKRGRPLA
jgi:tRNA A-37 threonylcarbamoyl transferase component Bud32